MSNVRRYLKNTENIEIHINNHNIKLAVTKPFIFPQRDFLKNFSRVFVSSKFTQYRVVFRLFLLCHGIPSLLQHNFYSLVLVLLLLLLL